MERLEEEESQDRVFECFWKEGDLCLSFNKADPLIATAYLRTLLSCHSDEDARISHLKEDKNLIRLHLSANIDQTYQLDNELELWLVRQDEQIGLRVKNIDGSEFETQWVHNYFR